MKLSIILPTYNERENIVPLINSLKENLGNFEKEIIVIDDDSPDGTGRLVEKLDDKEVKCIIRMNERGLATALMRGIFESSGDVLVFMDTDFSHHPKVIPRLLNQLGRYDLVFASRYVKGGGMLTERKFQYPLSKLLNWFIKTALWIPILDSTNGFFVSKKEIFKGLKFKKIFDGYGDYCFKLIYYLKKRRIKMKEIPFIYEKRKSGDSKTGILKVGVLYLKQVAKLRFS
ncbi:MAG: glycosyltransferase [Nanoarchaeota archaeon]|nr:glycosyltransferase [Nanoarchaeota archaeon]